MTPTTGPRAAADALDEAERLMRAGRSLAAVEALTEADRLHPDPAIEARLVTVRHRAFEELARPGSGTPWPVPAPDLFAGVAGIPEVPASRLSAEILGAGLQHHGSVLVRGLLDGPVCATITDEVVRAYAEAEAGVGAGVAPAYVPFEAGEGYDFGLVEHLFWRFGALLAVEAPRALLLVVEALKAAGVGDVIGEYFGEPPALSAKKTSLRRARPDAASEWHQDGAFLGDGTRTVNVWTALTPCGVDAPSVDVFARPFAGIVPTGTGGALYDWSVGQEEADRAGTNDVVRPEFDAGDALFFNQLTLHRTGVSSEMTRDRYAIESWFFAPSTYPFEQVPIAF